MVPLHKAKVLVLHPFLNFYGGAEYLLRVVVNEVVPQADIFTFSYRPAVLKEAEIDEKRIISPFGKSLLARAYRQMTPLYPSLMDTQAFDGYDVVLSFSYAYTHGLVTDNRTPHIAHIETPMRLLWLGASEYYWYDKVLLVRELYRSILAWQRVWDRQAATRPDYMLVNSKEVQQRVKAFWGRETEVVHPPVDTEYYRPAETVKKEDYFVTHSRLVEHKRIDVLIKTCTLAHKKLLVVGDGPSYKKLKRVANGSSDIVFTGYVSHSEKRDLAQKAKGFLFAADEDFGIAPVEALASGTPVLAYGNGGVLETITPDCGMLVKEQTAEAFSHAIDEFEAFAGQVSPKILFQQADRFSKKNFMQRYTESVEQKRLDFEQDGPPVLG